MSTPTPPNADLGPFATLLPGAPDPLSPEGVTAAVNAGRALATPHYAPTADDPFAALVPYRPPTPDLSKLPPALRAEHARRAALGAPTPPPAAPRDVLPQPTPTGTPAPVSSGIAKALLEDLPKSIAGYYEALPRIVFAPEQPEEAENPLVQAAKIARGGETPAQVEQDVHTARVARAQGGGPAERLNDFARSIAGMGYDATRQIQDARAALDSAKTPEAAAQAREGLTRAYANLGLLGGLFAVGDVGERAELARARALPGSPEALRAAGARAAQTFDAAAQDMGLAHPAVSGSAADLAQTLKQDRAAAPAPEAPAPPEPEAPAPTVEDLQRQLEQERTERRAAERALNVDATTGAASRAAFEKARPAADADPHTATVVFDLNNLKPVNELHGHPAGDAALTDAAYAIRAAATEAGAPDRVFRWGGDEFVALVPKDQAEAVRARAEELFGQRDAGPYKVSLTGRAGDTFADADAALRAAKGARAPGEAARPIAPAAAPAPVFTTPEGIVSMNPQDIGLDPDRFQFKQLGPEGVSAKLKGVTQYDPRLGGVLLVWRDPADGQVYVVNGHHRLELAQRAGAPSVNMQFLDPATAPDAAAARAEGAFVNIAEGHGTALDVAKFLRDTGTDLDALRARHIPVGEALATDGLALSRLAPDVFDQVASGKVPQAWGVALGERLEDPALQREALGVAKSAKGRLSGGEVREIARQVASAGTEDVQQETLFGSETERKALYVQKARLAAALKDRLASDRRLFGFVSKEGRAEQLGRAGATQIDVDAARTIAERSARAEELFDRLYTRAGPIAEVVNAGAKRIAQGERASAVAAELYPAVADAVEREIAGGAGAVPGRPGADHPPAESAGGEVPGAGGAAEPDRVTESTDPNQSGLFGAPAPEADAVPLPPPAGVLDAERPVGNPGAGLAGGLLKEQAWHRDPAGGVTELHAMSDEDLLRNYESLRRGKITRVRGNVRQLRPYLLEARHRGLIAEGADAPAPGARAEFEDRSGEDEHPAADRATRAKVGAIRASLREAKGVAASAARDPRAMLRFLNAMEDARENSETIVVPHDLPQPAKDEILAAIARVEGIADRGPEVAPAAARGEGARDLFLVSWLRKAERLLDNGDTSAGLSLLARVRAALDRGDSYGHQGVLDAVAHRVAELEPGGAPPAPEPAAPEMFGAERTDPALAKELQRAVAFYERELPKAEGAGLEATRRNIRGSVRSFEQRGVSPGDPYLARLREMGGGGAQAFRTFAGGGRPRATRTAPVATDERGPVTPLPDDTPSAAAQPVSAARDEVRRLFSPFNRSPAAAEAQHIVRAEAGQLALRYERAREALRRFALAFDARPDAERLDFIYRMEDDTPQRSRALTEAAQVFRQILDAKRDEIRALGTGKLEHYIRNYFPHIWADPDAAGGVVGRMLGRRPLEGSRGFLKRREILTTREGIEEHGLRPVTTNPADLVLLKLREMDKFLMGQRVVQALKDRGMLVFGSSLTRRPEGYEPLDDRVSTVYGPPHVAVHEAYDALVRDQLGKVIASLEGLSHERKVRVGGRALGYAEGPKGNRMVTKFGGPDSVIMHELGHIIDFRYGLWDYLTKIPGKDRAAIEARKTVHGELRALADLRHEGTKPEDVPDSQHAYVRNRYEKMANAITALLYAPDKMARVAPTVKARLTDFLRARPELKPLLDIEPSLVLGVGQAEAPTGGPILLGHWYAPETVARVVNNYLSPGFYGRSAIYDAFRGVGNLLNQAQLGLSAFHLGFTSLDAATSKVALAVQQAGAGRFFDAARALTEAPLAPVANVLRGDRLLRAYLTGGGTPELLEMAQAVAEAGGRVRMDDFYRTGALKALKQAAHEGRYGAAALRFLPAVLEAAAAPVLEYVVPRQKLGVFFDLARHELAQLPPGATLDARRAVLQRAWDSVDNRMGQLVYDNLFWNRAVKDLGLIAVRSLGWNIGTVRELGGGLVDAATAARRVRGGGALLTPRMAYAMALPATVAAAGAVATYLLTGRGPRSLKDYFYPPTGRKNPDGTAERLELPSYMKDVVSFANHPLRTVTNKLNPLPQTIYDMLANRDFYGDEIRNPDDPAVVQARQSLTFLAKQLEPFGIEQATRERSQAQSPGVSALSFVGVTPAPREIVRTKAQNRMAALLGQSHPEGRSPEAVAAARQKGTLLRDLRDRAPGAGAAVGAAVRSGTLSTAEAHRMVTRSLVTTPVEQFKQLTALQAADVYRLATPAERQAWLPVLVAKMQRAAADGDRAGLRAIQAVLAVTRAAR